MARKKTAATTATATTGRKKKASADAANAAAQVTPTPTPTAPPVKEDLTDGRLPSDPNHPLYHVRMEFKLDAAKKEVTFIRWYPFEPVEHTETFTFDELAKRECALDASDSPYAKWRYARHLEVEGICRDQLIDDGYIQE